MMKTAMRTAVTCVIRTTTLGLGLALMMSALAASARADIPLAPEVDPGSMASALTLLIGGALTLTGRKRRGR